MDLALLYSSNTEPVTIKETKKFLAVDHDEHDELINALITAARQRAEEYCNRSFVEKRYMLALDSWWFSGRKLKLPRSPVRQIVSVRYLVNGTYTTLAPDKYLLNALSTPPRITILETPGHDKVDNSITIEYITGYDVQGVEHSPVAEPVEGETYPDRTVRYALPGPVRTAILMMVRTMYDHRDDYVIGAAINQIPKHSEYLLKDYRIFEFL